MSLFKRTPNDRPRQRRVEPRQPTRQRQAPSVQGPAFSYYAARSQTDFNVGRVAQADQPIRKQPKPLQRLLLGHKRFVLLAIVIVFALLYNMQLSTTPKVVALTTTADAPFLRPTSVYKQAASALLNGSAANRNKLTVNGPAISAQLMKQFPELRDVSITLPLIGSQPTVYVQPLRPAAILTSSSGTFVLDENGRALVAASMATDLARFNVPNVIDQSKVPVTVGKPAIAHSAAEFIRSVGEQFAAKKISVSRMVLTTDASELDVYVSGKPYFVKFNLRDEGEGAAAAQIGTYLATADYLQKKGITPAGYVDARIAGRAYYK